VINYVLSLQLSLSYESSIIIPFYFPYFSDTHIRKIYSVVEKRIAQLITERRFKGKINEIAAEKHSSRLVDD